jgi:hypothetical protein
MKFSKLVAVGLLVAAPVSAAAPTRFNLACKPTKTSLTVNGKSVDSAPTETETLSVDLTNKLWCSRLASKGCGETKSLIATSTQIRLTDSLVLDRRSGVLTMNGQIGPISSLRTYSCIKQPFTSLPSVKF